MSCYMVSEKILSRCIVYNQSINQSIDCLLLTVYCALISEVNYSNHSMAVTDPEILKGMGALQEGGHAPKKQTFYAFWVSNLEFYYRP
jgi:hypothetical protein